MVRNGKLIQIQLIDCALVISLPMGRLVLVYLCTLVFEHSSHQMQEK